MAWMLLRAGPPRFRRVQEFRVVANASRPVSDRKIQLYRVGRAYPERETGRLWKGLYIIYKSIHKALIYFILKWSKNFNHFSLNPLFRCGIFSRPTQEGDPREYFISHLKENLMNPNAEKRTSGAHPRAVSSAPNFDTLETAEKLKKAEFADQQAMTLVETIQDAQAGLATKEDLVGVELALRGDMEKMETGIRRDMEKMEVGIRHDMEKMEAGIRGGMEKMEAGIRGDMEKMEAGIRGDMEKMGFGIRHEMEAGFRDMEIRFQKLQWYILSAIIGAASMFSAVTLYGGA